MKRTRRIKVATVCGFLFAASIPVMPVLAGTPDPGPDFDGDGNADLAIGVPYEDFGSVSDAGGVAVIYGSWNGLHADAPVDDQFWNQGSTGIQGTVERGDQFGKAVAVGDFDGDGYDDLAIGVPYEDLGSGSTAVINAGAIHVIYGSASGLSASGNQLLTQDTPGINDTIEPSDLFGYTLEAGEFGNGAEDDLVVGIPFEDIGSRADAGAVNVIYGSPSGLSGSGDGWWTQDSEGIADAPETGDRFGWSLATGNFGNGSVGGEDLAIGIPYEDYYDAVNDGAVAVIYNGWDGLAASQSQFLSVQTPEEGRRFGFSLAAANFGVSREADLAIGVPYEDFDGEADKGIVHVLYGDHYDGLQTPGQLWHQDRDGILEDAEVGDRFGYSLAAADFGKSPRADLAVGVPGETKVSGFENDRGTGGVSILYASSSVYAGLTTDDQFWWQDSSGIEGDTETGDGFGSSLAAADFGKAPTADLAVGVPGEGDEGDGDARAGAVNVLYGDSTTGIASTEDQFWWQDSTGVGDATDEDDRFGSALAD